VRGNPGLTIAIAVAISAACAPPVDGPIDHQRALDREDSDRLAAQLARLPGVVSASVVLHHAMRDPLAATAPSPAAFSAVIAVDDKAAPDAIRAAAIRLGRAAVPELVADAALPIEINAVVHRPTVTRVGPFSVEDSSSGPLKLTLAIGLLAIAGLAAALARSARRHRLGNSAQ
jgi:type III secretory pathway lipoprotein EscJ